jgi:hypothetical protein
MSNDGDGPRWTTRAHAHAVACPQCGAAAGDRCRGAEGQVRPSPHQARHQAAITAGAPLAQGTAAKPPAR